MRCCSVSSPMRMLSIALRRWACSKYGSRSIASFSVPSTRGGQRASVQGATRRGSGSRCRALTASTSETSQAHPSVESDHDTQSCLYPGRPALGRSRAPAMAKPMFGCSGLRELSGHLFGSTQRNACEVDRGRYVLWVMQSAGRLSVGPQNSDHSVEISSGSLEAGRR
jgi:hypothetical protein